ncbi:hypothetical protein MY11210_006466 [Beauveria gryllotalpidicola]
MRCYSISQLFCEPVIRFPHTGFDDPTEVNLHSIQICWEISDGHLAFFYTRPAFLDNLVVLFHARLAFFNNFVAILYTRPALLQVRPVFFDSLVALFHARLALLDVCLGFEERFIPFLMTLGKLIGLYGILKYNSIDFVRDWRARLVRLLQFIHSLKQ